MYGVSEADPKWYVKCTFETARYPWPLARKVLSWSEPAKGSVWFVMIVEVLESIEDRVDSVHIARQTVDRI